MVIVLFNKHVQYLNFIAMTYKSNKASNAIKRYKKVKKFVKDSIYLTDTDLNNYIQQLIQAKNIKTQLITEIVKH